MNKWAKIGLWVVGGIVGLLVLVVGVALRLLTPDRLAPLVNRYASEYLDADIRFSRIDISLFNDFPNVELSVVEGTVVSKAIEGRRDTLLSFARLDLACDAMAILRSNRIEVSGFAIDSTHAKAVIDPSGRASWDIVSSSDDAIKEDTSVSEPFVFNINNVRITGGLVVRLDDQRDSSSMEASLDELIFNGVGSTNTTQIKMRDLLVSNLLFEMSSDQGRELLRSHVAQVHVAQVPKGYSLLVETSSTVVQQGRTLAHELPLIIDGVLGFDLAHSNVFEVDNMSVATGDIVLGLNGHVDIASDSTLCSDLRLRLHKFPVGHALGLIPAHMMPWLGNLSSSVELELDTEIRGTYNFASGKLPNVDAWIKISDGFLRYRGVQARVDRFVLDARVHYNSDTVARSFAEVSRFDLNGSGIKLTAKARVDDFMGDPLVRGNIRGDLNLDVLSVIFPLSGQARASGHIEFSANCNSRVSNMELASLSRVGVTGSADFRSVSYSSPLDSLYAYTNGSLTFGSVYNHRDTTLALDMPIIRAEIDLDTICLKWGDDLLVNSARLDVVATTSAKFFKPNMDDVVDPFRFVIQGERMSVLMADSIMLGMRGVELRFDIDPLADDIETPCLITRLGARSILTRSSAGRFALLEPQFTLHSIIMSPEKDSIRRSEAMLDSLAKRYAHVERDKLFSYNKMMQVVGIAKKDDLASGDIDMTLDKDLLALLRRWQSTGTLSATSLRAITPYLPLTTALTDFDIRFDNDNLELLDAKLRMGRSDIEVTGKLSNIGRAISGDGNLVARMRVSGDTLDLNQLISAINVGMKVASTVDMSDHESISEERVSEIIEDEAENHSLDQLIIVPRNIDLDVLLAVNKAYYSDVVLDSLRGELISRDRVLQINNLHANSSIGRMALNAVYATRSKHDITTGFDVALSGVNVKELIDLIPEVDSMLPMLRSFEGHLDCKLAATASLDTTMSLLVPTLNAAASLSGRNMVLLDGETFTEFSKILRFKNRSRNLVDKISVEMLIRNSAVEIFPFIVSIDRYKAAVSGVQKLDMSFDYHISVLKSIIPFRVGVDIFGTDLDNWDFRVTKTRYKSENVPSYRELIDTTRLDLRRAITDIFKTGIESLVLKESAVTPHVDSSLMAAADSLRALSVSDSIAAKVGTTFEVQPTENLDQKDRREKRQQKRRDAQSPKSTKRNDDETLKN